MATQVPGRRPAHWRTQFRDHADTRTADCGIWAFLNARAIVSHGLLDVGPTPAEGRSAVRLARQLMGVSESPVTIAGHTRYQPTSTDDWYEAWTTRANVVAFKSVGLEAPRVSRLSGAPWSRVAEHLSAGRVVMLCVDYGVLRRGNAPTDSSSFSGGHALALAHYANVTGKVFDVTMDSLLSAPRVTRLRDYREAAGLFGRHPWGIGKLEGLSIAPARRIAKVPPDTTPEPTPAPDWTGITRAYDDLGTAIAAMKERTR